MTLKLSFPFQIHFKVECAGRIMIRICRNANVIFVWRLNFEGWQNRVPVYLYIYDFGYSRSFSSSL
jgi:hypothetical protein